MKKNVYRVLLSASLAVVGLAMPGKASANPLTYGALLTWTGTGASAGIDGYIYDMDIHSGAFRDVCAAPSGGCGGPAVLSDSYVLQGGDPYGGDTGDAFETTQADGVASVGGFGIRTHYDYGNPACADQVGTCIAAGPDTGWATFTNNTGSLWTGILDLSGTALGGIYGPAQVFDNSGAVSLADGASMSIVLNNESSNYGGYNRVDVVAPVPEPTSLLLLGSGLIGAVRRFRKSQVNA